MQVAPAGVAVPIKTPESKPITVYYSTKPTLQTPETPTSPLMSKRPSFEERYDQLQRERRGQIGNLQRNRSDAMSDSSSRGLPTSPLIIGERRRFNSSLSLASEESFPSLPSGPKSNPTTPVLKAWSSVVLRNAEDGNRQCKKPGRQSKQSPNSQQTESRISYGSPDWEEKCEIEFDEDGFPRYR
jgi:hypothetical protein